MAGILSVDSVIENAELDIFESVYRYIRPDEYDRTRKTIQNQLNKLEGHDAKFDIWFNMHRISIDGHEWRISQIYGLNINLGIVTEVDYRWGGVWSVNDTDAVMSYILTHLKEQGERSLDYDDEQIIFKLDGIKNTTKAKARRLDYAFEPAWHFTSEWRKPHEA